MTASAKLGNLLAINFSFESRLWAHGEFVAGGITAMAIRAGQTFLSVNVAGKLFVRHLQRSIEIRVTINADILGLGCGRRHE